MNKQKKHRRARRKTEWDRYAEEKQEYDELWVDEYLMNKKQLRNG